MPESFVNQATARCSVKGSKYWFNCNPEGPYHWFKLNWIDQAEQKDLLHLHFLMTDNPSLDEEIIERYRKNYIGVFFQRYILGLWVLAEGIIYPNFSKERHCTKSNESIPDKFEYYYVTSDYGITNPQVFLLCGINFIDKKPHIWILDEYYNVGKKKDKEKEEQIVKTDALFLKDYKKLINELYIKQTIIDPSATSLINLFKENNIKVKEANNAVIDGINLVSHFLEEEQIHIIANKCPNLIREFGSYIWDSKAQEKGIDEPVKQNDHALDALRYLLQTLFPIKKKGVYFYEGGIN